MSIEHIVQDGECLSTIAEQYGFTSWRTIYDAPENLNFRKKRPNPNVIYPGDVLMIPDREQRTDYNKPIDTRHVYKARRERWVFRIEMKDDEGNGVEGEPYIFDIAGEVPIKGNSGEGGLIEIEVPGHLRQARLKFLGEWFDVKIGTLDPVSRTKGIQERLNNLGFKAGPVDGIVGPKTRRAVYAFQLSQPSLKATGLIDDETRRQLLKVHDNDERITPAEDDMTPVEEDPPLKYEPPEDGDEPDESYPQQDTDWSPRRAYF